MSGDGDDNSSDDDDDFSLSDQEGSDSGGDAVSTTQFIADSSICSDMCWTVIRHCSLEVGNWKW